MCLCFSVGFDLTEPVRQAILALPERAWRPALTQAGEQRQGAAVAELALNLQANDWPPGTRAICRRERPHPGAQLTFTDDNGYRFQVFISNQQGRRIERLEQLHRQHAVVEDRIRCGKDTGLRNLPFRSFAANAAWLELVLCAQDLLAWTQRLLLSGELTLLFDLADLTTQIGDFPRAITVYRLLAHRAPTGSARWFAARFGHAQTLAAAREPAAARQIVEGTALLHPELGGPAMKKKFEVLRQKLERP